MRIVIDSYAWIEIFLGTKKGESAMNVIANAEIALTPEIVLAEIARKYMREGIGEKIIRERLERIAQSSELSGLDNTTAIESARTFLEIENQAKKAKSKRKPSLFDAVILATARMNDAKVVTGDEHFKGLEETLSIG